MPEVNGKKVYGLEEGRDSWLIDQLDPLIEAGRRHIDGLSLELRGISDNCEPIVSVHGNLNPSQLRLLADALENTPNTSRK